MSSPTLFDYYRRLGDSRVLLSFKGVFSQDTLAYLGDLVLNHIGFARDAKRVFAIYVEMAQNILHYAEERAPGDDAASVDNAGVGIITVIRQEGRYEITAGNFASSARRDRFVQQVTFVNSMDPKDLRIPFKQNLKSPAQAGSKGAGNGLIEIARKSDEPLRFEVHEAGPDTYFLVLTAIVRHQS